MRLVDGADGVEIWVDEGCHQRSITGIIHVDGMQRLPIVHVADIPAQHKTSFTRMYDRTTHSRYMRQSNAPKNDLHIALKLYS
jgi:hypothetical protein